MHWVETPSDRQSRRLKRQVKPHPPRALVLRQVLKFLVTAMSLVVSAATLSQPSAYTFDVKATTGPLLDQQSTGTFVVNEEIIPDGAGKYSGVNLFSEFSFVWNMAYYDETDVNDGGTLRFDSSGKVIGGFFGSNCRVDPDGTLCEVRSDADDWLGQLSLSEFSYSGGKGPLFLSKLNSPHVGTVLWTDQADGTDGSSDIARAVESYKNYVFAVGSLVNQGTGEDFFVRAYQADTGNVLWEDLVIGTGEDPNDTAHDVAAFGNRVFVVGVVRSATTGADFTVRAYQIDTGRLIWEDRHDVAGGFDQAMAVSASEGGISVAGNLDPSGRASELVMAIRTYNPTNGKLLWEDATLGDGASGLAFGVDTRNEQGIGAIVGTARGPDGSGAFTVRGYRAK